MKQLLSIVAVFAILTFSTVGFAQEEQQSKQPSKAELLKQYAKGAAGVVDYAFDDEGRLIKVVVVGKATISTVLGPRGEIVAERKAAMDCDAQFVQWFKKNMTVTENEDQEAIQRTTGSGNDDEVNREYEAKDSDNYSRVIESKASQVLRGMTPIYSGINPEKKQYVVIKGFNRKIAKAVKELGRELDNDNDEVETPETTADSKPAGKTTKDSLKNEHHVSPKAEDFF